MVEADIVTPIWKYLRKLYYEWGRGKGPKGEGSTLQSNWWSEVTRYTRACSLTHDVIPETTTEHATPRITLQERFDKPQWNSNKCLGDPQEGQEKDTEK